VSSPGVAESASGPLNLIAPKADIGLLGHCNFQFQHTATKHHSAWWRCRFQDWLLCGKSGTRVGNRASNPKLIGVNFRHEGAWSRDHRPCGALCRRPDARPRQVHRCRSAHGDADTAFDRNLRPPQLAACFIASSKSPCIWRASSRAFPAPLHQRLR
jgi:hypothetical protein